MVVKRVTAKDVAAALAATDWDKVDATTDVDIARHIAEDADTAPEMTDAQFAAAKIRRLRRRLGLSQLDFASRFGIPVGTLRDWEQARSQPDTTAQSYLRVIERSPQAVEQALGG
jgi:putative transcriptional regulator